MSGKERMAANTTSFGFLDKAPPNIVRARKEDTINPK
jgi:hypothetical protein